MDERLAEMVIEIRDHARKLRKQAIMFLQQADQISAKLEDDFAAAAPDALDLTTKRMAARQELLKEQVKRTGAAVQYAKQVDEAPDVIACLEQMDQEARASLEEFGVD